MLSKCLDRLDKAAMATVDECLKIGLISYDSKGGKAVTLRYRVRSEQRRQRSRLGNSLKLRKIFEDRCFSAFKPIAPFFRGNKAKDRLSAITSSFLKGNIPGNDRERHTRCLTSFGSNEPIGT